MKFTKMHGIGNDYIYVDAFREVVGDPEPLARTMSDRHFGVGGDGLILIQPARTPGTDCRMEMYNADGSRAQMCGNGLRCVAKYAFDHGISRQTSIRVETDAGVKQVRVVSKTGERAELMEVDMGPPRLERSALPLVDGQDSRRPAIDLPIVVDGNRFWVTCVSMGNPHAVLRLDRAEREIKADLGSLDGLDLEAWGPRFENHSWFPERVNTEFIVVRSREEIDLRVWERGSGETLACGTGACAAVVAAVLNDWCTPDVTVHLRGGDLRVRWENPGIEGGGSVYMRGAATEVFSGEWPS